jgi:hypothetical protein
MNQETLERWLRTRNTATTDELRKVLKLRRPGGSTWIQVARVLTYHGFVRDLSGWVRQKPSPAGPCPSYRDLQKLASERRARCRAALVKERTDPAFYEPINRDPGIQDPDWSSRGPRR